MSRFFIVVGVGDVSVASNVVSSLISKVQCKNRILHTSVNLYLTRVIPSEILKSISVINRSTKLRLIKKFKIKNKKLSNYKLIIVQYNN